MKRPKVKVIGGGLAGVEASYQALKGGAEVELIEMRPQKMTPAHHTGDLAELVCSNSLKSLDEGSASGRLKKEMEALDSIVLRAAFQAKVPAGQALAVERRLFSSAIEKELASFPGFKRLAGEFSEIPTLTDLAAENSAIILATGPLTTETLATEIQKLGGGSKFFHFYDAIAPILEGPSLDYGVIFRQNRYDKGDTQDYFNIPLDKLEYESFIDAVQNAEMTALKDFEDTAYFEACLPIEVMIARGRDTLRFGPMKPTGLIDPRSGKRPWACVQLRREDPEGQMLSMVGFQTKMKWPEQKRIFKTLPGLQNAEFFRLGSVHRNAYIQSPKLLSEDLSFKNHSRVFVAGQLSGVEGYTESAALGILAGKAAFTKLTGGLFTPPPRTTVIGALHHYVTQGSNGAFQPMNAHLGLLPPGQGKTRDERRAFQCMKAAEGLSQYCSLL